MSGRFLLGRRADSERGAVLVFTTLLLTGLLGMTAIVVDLGALRGNARVDQSVADFAALAAGPDLANHKPTEACQAAVNYINANLASAINASCPSAWDTTPCSAGSPEATPFTTSVGNYTVSIHYPVPDAKIFDANTGGRLNDGTPCQRMRVVISSTQQALFAGILGTSSLSATRSATVRASSVGPQKAPALWLLDPTGCALAVSGGAQVTVGTVGTTTVPAVPGVITVDSDGLGCNQYTVSSTTSSLLKAVGSGSDPGLIQLFALPPGATSCPATGFGATACDQSDVDNGQLLPQPAPVSARATRSRVDDVYNCQPTYPNYHGITLVPNCSTPAYINNLKIAVGASGVPSIGTWTPIGPDPAQCSPSASITYPVGNYYVNCTKNNGFVVNSDVTVTFSGGNVVFDGGVTVSNGGTLNFNTANTNPALSSSCRPPAVQTPCMGSSSASAAIVYIRGDNGTEFSTSGTGTVNAHNVFVYGGTGSIAFRGKSLLDPLTWTAPTEGPFGEPAGLAYWTDMPATATNAQRTSFIITGGSGANLTGVFFIPEASFTLAGGADWGQQNAQFITYQLQVTGNGALTMAPDPDRSVKVPTLAGTLIR